MGIKHIGFLHPGLMGESLAATARNTGHAAYWASEGRSLETEKRAEKNGLIDTKTVEELCGRCSVIVSVCPPHAAVDVAEHILSYSFKGIYADVNAISPQRTRQIGQLVDDSGAAFVDGGIIGGPAWKPGTTWLYLSGQNADRVAACFSGGPLETEIIGNDIGRASALKMCFAANTKGTTALLCAIAAAAEKMGVRTELEKQWDRYDKGFAKETRDRIQRVTAKAWRFSGEMEEIASTFERAGVPGGFHMAACDIYLRMAGFKGADPLPPLDDILSTLLTPEKG